MNHLGTVNEVSGESRVVAAGTAINVDFTLPDDGTGGRLHYATFTLESLLARPGSVFGFIQLRDPNSDTELTIAPGVGVDTVRAHYPTARDVPYRRLRRLRFVIQNEGDADVTAVLAYHAEAS